MRGNTRLLTLRDAAHELNEEVPFIKGIIVGLGETMSEAGTSLCISEKTFLRVKTYLANTDVPRGHRSRHKTASA